MLTDVAAIAALEANAWSMFSILGRGTGGSVVDTPNRLIYQSPIVQPPYNGVLRFYDDGSAPIRDQVRAVLEPFRARGVPVIWLVHPSTAPGVTDALSAEGMTLAEELPGMVADLSDLEAPQPVAGVEIFEATRAESHAWRHLVSWRYGLDSGTSEYLEDLYSRAIGGHTRLWLARIGDEYVSKAGLHVQDGVAGIYGVVTTEAGRNRGLASALTLAALNAARDEGVRTAVLHSTPMAENLYGRLGFQTVAQFEFWSDPGTIDL